ncbi:hypothetical protein TNCV_4091891 [Trichonephila clavipes]|nr:hypothetical protein TNCV_4091891 [Trichonephila clavipes]
MEPKIDSPSEEHHMITPESTRYFIMKMKETFTNVSPFLIEKTISSTVETVKTIRKMRSGDLFLEVSSSKEATILANQHKLSQLVVTIVPHDSLKHSRGVITPANFLIGPSEEIIENLRTQKIC